MDASSLVIRETMSGVHPPSSATSTHSAMDDASPGGFDDASPVGFDPGTSAFSAFRLDRIASSVATTASTMPLPATNISGVLPPS